MKISVLSTYLRSLLDEKLPRSHISLPHNSWKGKIEVIKQKSTLYYYSPTKNDHQFQQRAYFRRIRCPCRLSFVFSRDGSGNGIVNDTKKAFSINAITHQEVSECEHDNDRPTYDISIYPEKMTWKYTARKEELLGSSSQRVNYSMVEKWNLMRIFRFIGRCAPHFLKVPLALGNVTFFLMILKNPLTGASERGSVCCSGSWARVPSDDKKSGVKVRQYF